jgi:predicted nucleic acid-binding protein
VVIVDSSVWIDFLYDRTTPQTEWLEAAIRGDKAVGLTTLILCEVLQGVRFERQFREFSHDLTKFPVFETGSAALAVQAARNHRILRQKGITVRKTIDCLIATFCIEADCQLLHRDRDFDAFAEHLGLRVIDPSPLPLH